MAKHFWSKFEWQSWRTDPGLARCSKAAKGVWMDMLALMHECDDRGVLASAGSPWSDQEIAEAIGGDPAVNLECIHELLSKGVASRNGSGAIFCRRMVREAEISRARSQAGSKGGSKTQAKVKANTQANLSDFDSDSDSSNRGESEGGREPPGFTRWWKAYPGKKTEKPRCLAIWRGERPMADGQRRKLEPLADAIVEAVIRQHKAKQWRSADGKDYIPQSSTWLYNGRWDDEVADGCKPAGVRLDDLTDDQKNRAYQLAIRRNPNLDGLPKGLDSVRSAVVAAARELDEKGEL